MVMVTVENPVGGRRSKLGLTQVLGLKSPEKTGSSSPKNSKMMGGLGLTKTCSCILMPCYFQIILTTFVSDVASSIEKKSQDAQYPNL